MDKKQQVIELWRTCFTDSEAFICLYFERVYQDENTLTLERGGRMISALQMLPYTMTYLGAEIPIAYLAGVCTAPEERGRGWMRQLLREASCEMERRGIALATLIPAEPWLFDYYRREGYTEAFYFSPEICHLPHPPIRHPAISVSPSPLNDVKALQAYLDQKLRERPTAILHTQEDLATNLRDLQLDNGGASIAMDPSGQIMGAAFAHPTQTEEEPVRRGLLVKELIYDSPAIKDALLQELLLRYNVSQAIVKTPACHPDARPQGMARLIDRERLTTLWLSHHPKSLLTSKDLMAMDAQALTRFLFHFPRQTAFMSLMLDE